MKIPELLVAVALLAAPAADEAGPARYQVRRTARGPRPWEWSDLQAALEATAPLDWQSFHGAHIRGDKPLPLAEVFARAGLRLGQAEDGSPRRARHQGLRQGLVAMEGPARRLN